MKSCRDLWPSSMILTSWKGRPSSVIFRRKLNKALRSDKVLWRDLGSRSSMLSMNRSDCVRDRGMSLRGFKGDTSACRQTRITESRWTKVVWLVVDADKMVRNRASMSWIEFCEGLVGVVWLRYADRSMTFTSSWMLVVSKKFWMSASGRLTMRNLR